MIIYIHVNIKRSFRYILVLKRIIELREEESAPLEKDEQLKKYPQELVNYYNKKYDYLNNNKVIATL